MITSYLRNSWCSPKLTSMQETGAIIAISLRACLLLFANPRPALQPRPNSPQSRHRLQQTRCGCIPAQRGCSAVSLPSVSLLASRYCAVNLRPLRPSEWRAFAVARARRCARPCCARTRRLVRRQVLGAFEAAGAWRSGRFGGRRQLLRG
jgi:hypothetical protein